MKSVDAEREKRGRDGENERPTSVLGGAPLLVDLAKARDVMTKYK